MCQKKLIDAGQRAFRLRCRRRRVPELLYRLQSPWVSKALKWMNFVPTMIRSGSVITERANCSTAAGIVAENNALWRRFEVHAANISSVCSSKPNSNNLSASSRTRYSTLH